MMSQNNECLEMMTLNITVKIKYSMQEIISAYKMFKLFLIPCKQNAYSCLYIFILHSHIAYGTFSHTSHHF